MPSAPAAVASADARATRRGTVGIIVNPVAGKDIRRLSSGASHTPDTTKIGIVTRVVAAAVETGVARLVVADDPHRLGRRAVERSKVPDDVEVVFLSGHVAGSRDDTIGAAREMHDDEVDVVVALGGDGTCRDVATGWGDVPLVAISTGTNNVYPRPIDATSAGVAAGLVATGEIDLERVAEPTKRIVVRVDPTDDSSDRAASDVADDVSDDVALVDLALVDGVFVGARAVTDPGAIRTVLAAIGEAPSTGLSSIAGRAAPVDRHTKGGVEISLVPVDASSGDPGESAVRHVRVPLTPGSFSTIAIAGIRPVADGEPVEWTGPGVLAFDGERDLPIGASTRVVAHIERTGPRLIDVDRAVSLAAFAGAYDRPPSHSTTPLAGGR